MASFSLIGVSIAIFCYVILRCFPFKKPQDRSLINWPVLGMLPGLFLVFHRIHDFTTEVLENKGLTFSFMGPWLWGMDMLITADPANIHYMVSSNFSNFGKGADYKEAFDVLEDSLLTKDGEAWKKLSKVTRAMVNHQKFLRFSMSTTRSKINDGLVPLLNNLAEEGKTIDLQDVFSRFMFDTFLVTTLGCDDPKSLSTDMPKVESVKALDDIGEGILYRNIQPRLLWKLQRWIGVGMEKKIIEANAIFDELCAKYIHSNGQGINQGRENEDLMTSHINLDTNKYKLLNPINDKFLRDTVIGFLLAGRDTIAAGLTWFFWLLSENPNVVTKIRQEIDTILPRSSTLEEVYDSMENLNKLVYLHAALYETMRLYPPIPVERVSPIESDVLPSGHKIEANSKILIFIYTLGRLRTVWGENALEFKPERWISETGELRHEPFFNYLVFNGGPRVCPGKDIAMTRMKTVAVEILQNYDIQVVKGQNIKLDTRLFLTMKHGFKVTVTKRFPV